MSHCEKKICCTIPTIVVFGLPGSVGSTFGANFKTNSVGYCCPSKCGVTIFPTIRSSLTSSTTQCSILQIFAFTEMTTGPGITMPVPNGANRVIFSLVGGGGSGGSPFLPSAAGGGGGAAGAIFGDILISGGTFTYQIIGRGGQSPSGAGGNALLKFSANGVTYAALGGMSGLDLTLGGGNGGNATATPSTIATGGIGALVEGKNGGQGASILIAGVNYYGGGGGGAPNISVAKKAGNGGLPGGFFPGESFSVGQGATGTLAGGGGGASSSGPGGDGGGRSPTTPAFFGGGGGGASPAPTTTITIRDPINFGANGAPPQITLTFFSCR